MKKISLLLIIMAVCSFVAVIAAVAGTVGDRVVVPLAATTGVGTWEMPHQYASAKLARISVVSNSEATNTVTVSRIITESTGVYTQTVGSVVCTGGVGTQTTLAYSTLLLGDKLAFSSLVATGGVVVVEYDVSKH